MTTVANLARQHADLPPVVLDHLQRLVAEWEIIADLYFSDLLLFVPVEGGDRFLVLAHVRPTNSQTIYREDPVGRAFAAPDRPWVAQAWASGEIVGGDVSESIRIEQLRVEAVPVRCRGKVVAVLSRESWLQVGRRPSPLEEEYAEAGADLARMVADGTFPYHASGAVLTETVRVGDGLIRLDHELRVRYVSPNAISALHRLRIIDPVDGLTLSELGVDDTSIRAAVRATTSATGEWEGGDVSILMLALPIITAGRPSGAILVVRDVTELRRRDRLLMSKDATIREIHHRVKNNLQTIASLLRLQARRLESREAKVALEESVRRIKSIALVHETLAREAGGMLPFDSILRPLVRDVEEGLVGDRRIAFEIEGDAGILPAAVATPLAVVLTELLQNTVEHGYPEDDVDTSGTVQVEIVRDARHMTVDVVDDGVGFGPGFSLEEHANLGLQIVKGLVQAELEGTLAVAHGPEAGAHVRIEFPLPTVADVVMDPGSGA